MPRDVVRHPLRARGRRGRTLDQRVFLRFPRLAAWYGRLIGALSPGSRLRRASVLRIAELTVDAYNRRDLEAVTIGCHPEFEWRPDPRWVDAGLLEPSYRGLEGYRRYVHSTAEVFGAEVIVKPVELVDAGEHLVLLAEVPMRAQASGVPLTEKWALGLTMKDGQTIRLREYYDYGEALDAAGARRA